MSDLGQWVLHKRDEWSTQRGLTDAEFKGLWMNALGRDDQVFAQYCNDFITWKFWDQTVLNGLSKNCTSKLEYLGAPCLACYRDAGAVDIFRTILREMFEISPMKPEDLKRFL